MAIHLIPAQMVISISIVLNCASLQIYVTILIFATMYIYNTIRYKLKSIDLLASVGHGVGNKFVDLRSVLSRVEEVESPFV